MAERLAEDPTVSVAVIEAGSFYEIDNGNISQIPVDDSMYSLSSPSQIQPLIDWGVITEPQAVWLDSCRWCSMPLDGSASADVSSLIGFGWSRGVLCARKVSRRKV